MKFLNYFDIPKEELEDKEVMEYLQQIFKKINAPKGKIQAWFSLPHQDDDMRRVCVYYKIDEEKGKEAAK